MSNAVLDLFATLSLDTKSYEEGLSGAEKSAGSFSKGFSNVMKTGGAAIAALGTATIAAGTAITNATGNVASYGDTIDKMSQKMGLSTKAYQEWDAVLQHSGASISSLQPSIKTRATQAESGSDAFQKLGISQEEVATLSQEDLFARTIEGLQEMEEGTERTALASQLLGRGATELGALLNTSAEDTQKMKDRVNELGGVMSEEAVKSAAAYQDQLQDMQTAFSGLSRNLASDFMPSMTGIMEGLTGIFSGNYTDGLDKISDGVDSAIDNLSNAMPKVLEVGAKILESLAMSLVDNIPKIFPSLTSLVLNIAETLVQELPTIAKAGLELIVELATGIAQALPELVPSIIGIVYEIEETLLDNIDLLIDAAIQLCIGLATGIIKAAPVIIEKVPEISIKVLQAIIDNIPVILDGIIQLILEIGKAIIETDWMALGKKVIEGIKTGIDNLFTSIPNTIKSIGQSAFNLLKNINWNSLGQSVINFITNGIKSLVTAIPNAIKSIATQAFNAFKNVNWMSLGSALIDGIVSGITGGLGKIVDAAKGAAQSAFDAAKKLLGIASPSKKGKWIGQMFDLGIAGGIEDSVGMIEDSASDAADAMYDTVSDGSIGFENMSKASEAGSQTNNSIVINISGVEGKTARELADIIDQRIAEKTNRSVAVWA